MATKKTSWFLSPDANNIEKASPEELIAIAQRNGLDLSDYECE